MKKLSAKPIYDRIINFTPVVLMALMPLFFLPITTEYFEFNKQVLLILGTILLLVTWAFKTLFGKQMEITKSVMDMPFIGFLGVVILSTIFSVNQAVSIYGSDGRAFPSLLGYGVLILFYYLISSGINSIGTMKNVLNALVYSISLNSFITILSYFGVYLGKSAFLQTYSFTPTGSVTTSIVIAGVSSIVSISLMVYNSQHVKAKAIYLVSTLVNVTLIALVNVWFGWALFLAGLVVMTLVLKAKTLTQCKVGLMTVLVFATLLGVLRNVPQTSRAFVNNSYPYEIVLPLRASWSVATSVIREYPLLATGGSTFYLDFTRYRPLFLNNTDLWNIRFDKPFNELLNVISEFGLLGLAAFIYIGSQLIVLVKKSAKAKEDNYIIKVLGVAVAVATLVYLVTYATTLNTFVLVLLTALLVRSMQLEETFEKVSHVKVIPLAKVNKVVSVTGLEEESLKHSPFKLVIVIPALLLAVYVGFVTTKNYMAEFFTRSSIYAAQSNNWDKVYKYQEAAIKANPLKDSLYVRHAQTILILANSIAAKGDLTEDDKTLIQNLVAQSINVAKVASENVNPLNVRTWETRALIYKNISQAAQNATEWGIASYNIAVQLDPTNPKLRLDLGGMYYAKGDYLSAASQFRQAISLKSNYANAYYNFAQALAQLGDYSNAKASLETTKSLVPANSEDFKQVSAEIEVLNQKLSSMGTTTEQKPTVEQIQAKEEPKAAIQEPLNTVGNQQPTIGSDIKENTLVEQKN
jgi:tetratricopeptide (TPR) repeat protein